LTQSAYRDIVHHAARRGGFTEEGGPAVGAVLSLTEILIAAIGGPGPDSKRTATSYRPDGAHDYYFVKNMVALYGDSLGQPALEVASWHLHPSGGDWPSQPDLESMAPKYSGVLDDPRRHTFRPGWPELIVTPSATHGLERPNIAAWVTHGHHSIADWFVCQRAELKIRS
jgi:proteasome lid subunit RPN8/RPN11